MNNHWRASKKSLILTAVITISGCQHLETSGTNSLKRVVEDIGYTYYDPPRALGGPGWVFELVRTFDGRTVPGTVCLNLYPTADLTPDPRTFPDVAVDKDTSVDFGISFLVDLIRSPGSAKANLNNVSSLDIDWGSVTVWILAREQGFETDPNGTKIRPVDPKCAGVLRDAKKMGEFDDRFFIVTEAPRVDTLDYTFSLEREVEVGGAISWQDALTLDAGVDAEQTADTVLKIKEPRYVGFVAVAVEDFVPTGTFARPRATVTTRKISSEDFRRLFR